MPMKWRRCRFLTAWAWLMWLPACAPAHSLEIVVAMDEQSLEAARLAYTDFAAAWPETAERVRVRLMPAEVGDRALASLTAMQLVAEDERVVGVVGFTTSTPAIAVEPVLERARLPHIAPVVTSASYADGTEYSFRLVPSDEKQAAFLVAEAWKQVPDARRIVLYYIPTDYSRSFKMNVSELVRARGAEIVYEAAVPLASEDMARSARVAANAQPDLVIWISWVSPANSDISRLINEFRARGMTTPIFGSDAADGPATFTDLEQYGGMRVVRFDERIMKSALATRLRERFGQEARMSTLLTYDAVATFLNAVHEGAETRADVQAYLLSLGRTREPLPGWGGPIAFDSTYSLSRNYLMQTVGAPADSVFQGLMDP